MFIHCRDLFSFIILFLKGARIPLPAKAGSPLRERSMEDTKVTAAKRLLTSVRDN
jgi:hypothetical protein